MWILSRWIRQFFLRILPQKTSSWRLQRLESHRHSRLRMRSNISCNIGTTQGCTPARDPRDIIFYQILVLNQISHLLHCEKITNFKKFCLIKSQRKSVLILVPQFKQWIGAKTTINMLLSQCCNCKKLGFFNKKEKT